MDNRVKEEYEPFGEEWKKEISKLPKANIIEMLAAKGKLCNDLKDELKDKGEQLAAILLTPNFEKSTENLSKIKDKDKWLNEIRGDEKKVSPAVTPAVTPVKESKEEK